MRAQGIAPQGFLTRAAATTLAAAVGASQIVTGRWSTLALAPQPDEPAGVSPRGNEHRATAILEIWVMDGTSGAVLLQAAYTGRAWGAGGRIVLLDAAREVVELVRMIQGKVRETFGVEIHPEPNLVGVGSGS